MGVFRAQLGLICVRQIQVWPYLSVDDEQCEFLDRMDFDAIFPQGVLPYMGHIGMCRCEGYGFQAVYSSVGYINQSVWV